ncbi:MAG: hypothetical protein P8M68_03600 [Aquiluna sp.]|nr:hypothetical protein [Aquiluna sp.]
MLSQPTQEINTQLSKKPRILLLAVLITALQSVALWGLALWSLISVLQGNSLSLVSAAFLTGLVAAGALFLSNVALGMLRLRRWAYTPSFVMQLLIVSIGVASFGGEYGVVVIGLGLLVPSTFVFVTMLSKNVRLLFREA